jgi:hypothetical protein
MTTLIAPPDAVITAVGVGALTSATDSAGGLSSESAHDARTDTARTATSTNRFRELTGIFNFHPKQYCSQRQADLWLDRLVNDSYEL